MALRYLYLDLVRAGPSKESHFSIATSTVLLYCTVLLFKLRSSYLLEDQPHFLEDGPVSFVLRIVGHKRSHYPGPRAPRIIIIIAVLPLAGWFFRSPPNYCTELLCDTEGFSPK